MMLRPRLQPFRSADWLAAVHTIENCVRCGAHGIHAAHRNQGKGTSMKASDCLVAALCPACHHAIDNGKHMTLAERREEMDTAILATIEELAINGRIGAQ